MVELCFFVLPIKTASVFFPHLASFCKSRILFKFKTPTLNNPNAIEGYKSLSSKIESNKKFDPKTLTSPKKTKTKKSPSPKYPYANFPTVYLMAEKIANPPSAAKIKT